MTSIRCHLFGRPRVVLAGSTAVRIPSRGIEKLLVVLLLGRYQLYPRDALADLLWPREEINQARHRLRTAVWRLRCFLEPQGTPRGMYLHANARGDIGLNPENGYWLDVENFERAVNKFISGAATDI